MTEQRNSLITAVIVTLEKPVSLDVLLNVQRFQPLHKLRIMLYVNILPMEAIVPVFLQGLLREGSLQ